MKRATAMVLTAMALLLFIATRANADGITYTETVVANGNVGNEIFFPNNGMTITFVGNTSNVTPNCPEILVVPCNPVGTATVTIEGVAPVGSCQDCGSETFTITDQLFAFSDQRTGPVVGLGDFDQHLGTIMSTFNSGFAAYDLRTNIGPLTGPTGPPVGCCSLLGDTIFLNTNAGPLTFTIQSDVSTFAATVVPEPGSLLLLGTSLSGLALFRRRRQP